MGMDEEHHEYDFVLNSIMNWKPVKTGSEVTWSGARRPILAERQHSEDAGVVQ